MEFELWRASKMLSELDLQGITFDNMEVNVLWFRAMSNSGNWVIGRHTHSSFEFHFIYSGSCRVILDDGEFDISAGEFYLTAPGVYHEQQALHEDKFIEYSINCDILPTNTNLTEAQYIYRILKDSPCQPYQDVNGAINQYTAALIEAYNRKTGFYSSIRSLILLIITCAARSMETSSSSPSHTVPLKSHKDDYRYLLVEKYIHDNLSSSISTGDIAKHLYLSEKQVCRIVMDKKKMSTKELITSIKLQKAKSLLRNTDMPIKQISDALGFSSEYYFSQFFKRVEGYPPIIFRSNVQKI